MTEFISWSTLTTYGGALAMVALLTQGLKDIKGIKELPPQVISYFLAVGVLITAHAFTTGLSVDIFAQTIFNAAIISFGSNGAFSAINKLFGKDTDGDLIIDIDDQGPVNYEFALGRNLEGLENRKSIRLNVKPRKRIKSTVK